MKVKRLTVNQSRKETKCLIGTFTAPNTGVYRFTVLKNKWFSFFLFWANEMKIHKVFLRAGHKIDFKDRDRLVSIGREAM